MATLLLLSVSLSAVAQTTTFQAADLHDFVTGDARTGAGTMIRSEDVGWVNFSLSGLDKKAAYTGWRIVFNDPGDCMGGAGHCGGDDLPFPANGLQRTIERNSTNCRRILSKLDVRGKRQLTELS